MVSAGVELVVEDQSGSRQHHETIFKISQSCTFPADAGRAGGGRVNRGGRPIFPMPALWLVGAVGVGGGAGGDSHVGGGRSDSPCGDNGGKADSSDGRAHFDLSGLGLEV